MRSLNEALLEEQPDKEERLGYIDIGKALTPFEKKRLEEDPTRPIYQSAETEQKAILAYCYWELRTLNRRRDIPVTLDNYDYDD
jgi:hypothetical protein